MVGRGPRTAALLFGLAVGAVACTATAPASRPAAEPPPVVSEATVAQPAASPPPPTATVTGSSLNVREQPTTNAPVVARARRGERLPILAEQGTWLRVRLADGREGWVSSRYVRRRAPCPDDKVTAEIIEAPPLSFADTGGHGTVKIEAEVDPSGKVVTTRVVENTAGDAAAALAESELARMRFSPPVKHCRPVRFIYIYTRTF